MKRRRLATFVALGLLGAAYLLSLSRVLPWRIFGTAEREPRVILRFAHWQLEAGLREAFDVLAHRYMELHPDVRVEQIAVPGTVYKQWLSTQIAGGTVPDLVSFNSIDQALMAQLPRHFEALSHWLEEPNPYNAGTRLAGVPWRLTFIDGGRNRATYLEQFRNYFAVGLCSHSMRMFYNRDLLREVTGSDRPPRTFQEWRELGAKVRSHRPGLVHVAGSRENAIWIMPTFVNQSVGLWILSGDRQLRFSATNTDFFADMLHGDWSLRSPEMQRALRVALAFGAEMPPGFLQLDRNTALQSFLRGDALSIPTGTWDYPTMRAEAPFEIGAFRFPLPAADDAEFGGLALTPVSDGTQSTALPLYLSKTSRHKEVAIDFLRFATGLEGNELFSRHSHWMPAVEGVPILPELQPFQQMLEGFMIADPQNGPSLMAAGADYARLVETNLHRLYGPGGNVADFTEAVAPEAAAAVRTDLQKQIAIQRENFRRRDLALGALHFLGSAEQAEATRQFSGQHLVEVQTLLLAGSLEQTTANP